MLVLFGLFALHRYFLLLTLIFFLDPPFFFKLLFDTHLATLNRLRIFDPRSGLWFDFKTLLKTLSYFFGLLLYFIFDHLARFQKRKLERFNFLRQTIYSINVDIQTSHFIFSDLFLKLSEWHVFHYFTLKWRNYLLSGFFYKINNFLIRTPINIPWWRRATEWFFVRVLLWIPWFAQIEAAH